MTTVQKCTGYRLYYSKKISSLQCLLRTTSATRKSLTANMTKDDITCAAHRQNVTVL